MFLLLEKNLMEEYFLHELILTDRLKENNFLLMP